MRRKGEVDLAVQHASPAPGITVGIEFSAMGLDLVATLPAHDERVTTTQQGVKDSTAPGHVAAAGGRGGNGGSYRQEHVTESPLTGTVPILPPPGGGVV